MSFISLDEDDDPFTSQSVITPSSPVNSTLTLPNRLIRIRGLNVYQWTLSLHETFLNWWHLQPWYLDHAENEELDRQINWDSSGRTSSVWKSFDQGADIRTGKPVVICQKCNTLLAHPGVKKTGTNTMRIHLTTESCSKRSFKQSQPQSRSQRQISLFSSSPKQSSFTSSAEEDFQDLVLHAIISMNIGFKAVQDPGWRALSQWQNAKFPLPSEKTVRRRLDVSLSRTESTALKGLVPGSKCALALDNWSSPSIRHSFMAIIALFIDKDWNTQEVLIGFELLYRTHSGKELAAVVYQVMETFHIKESVHSIITDNASNNSTLIQSINELVEELQKRLQRDTLDQRFFGGKIQHIPCFAHIVQLALKALLGEIRISPTNTEIQLNWDDEKSKAELGQLKTSKGIAWTLAKLRKFSVFINSSSQRQERFMKTQKQTIKPGEPLLRLLQDVSTRWDSTTHMMIRALLLRPTIDKLTADWVSAQMFALDSDEWRQISYLIDIIRPFSFWTTNLGSGHCSRLGYIFIAYDELFDHLDECSRRLKPLRHRFLLLVPNLISAIKKATRKLDMYYNKSYSDLGSFYALGSLLTPELKQSVFDPDYCWLQSEEDWGSRFESQFRELYNQYYLSKTLATTSTSVVLDSRDWDPLFLYTSQSRKGLRKQNEFLSTLDDNEIDRYLSTVPNQNFILEPLKFWKANEAQFPRLATMARDLLCIPVAGTLVERVFSYARDVCDYRRNRLSPATIRAILLVSWKLKTDLRSAQILAVLETTALLDISEEEIVIEWQRRADQILEKLDLKFIPDLEPNPPLIEVRTYRNQRRTILRKERRKRYKKDFLKLGPEKPRQFLDRNQEAEVISRAEIQARIENTDSSIYDPPEPSSNEEIYDDPKQIDLEDEVQEQSSIQLDSDTELGYRGEDDIDELDTDLIDNSPLGLKRRHQEEEQESRKKISIDIS